MREKNLKLYRQEGRLGLYQTVVPFLATLKPILRYLPKSYGELWLYYKEGYMVIFLQLDKMEEVSRAFFKKSKNGFPKDWISKWKVLHKDIESLSKDIWKADLTKLTNQELWAKYQEIYNRGMDMWALSIFIDAFDPGHDQHMINKISHKHGFKEEEKQILLSPLNQSYITELDNAYYKFNNNEISTEDFLNRFYWVGTDYRIFTVLDEKWIREKSKYAEINIFESPLEEQKKILKKYNLDSNPFEIFQILAEWRDERKRLNYIAIYGCVKLIREGLKRQNIDESNANFLLNEEIKDVFLGKINTKTIINRDKEGILLNGKVDGEMLYITGTEAEEKFNYLKQFLPNTDVSEIKGTIACKGNKKGIVRVVRHLSSIAADNLKDGDILVTSMTRPEFVPLMKKAGAIITDEGGISSHAAIVARELNIPCIIGTKIATDVLKDGMEVKVDANKGIIKILKNK